jgi:hypothetical protein
MWWLSSVIPALVRLRQEDWKFKASLGCIARPCLKNKTKQKVKQPKCLWSNVIYLNKLYPIYSIKLFVEMQKDISMWSFIKDAIMFCYIKFKFMLLSLLKISKT